eukprot:g17411.t1
MKDVSASVCFLSLLLCCVVLSKGFLTPVPVTRSRALGTKPLAETYKSRVYERRHATMSAAHGNMPSSGVSDEEASRPPSRLSRISGRVRKMIRKAIMGYVPEEEVSYKERAAQQAAAAAKLRGEPEIADERLRGASVAAKAAAIEAVEQSVLAEDDEDDILNSGFVQLNIGNQSPMEAEDKLASLRKRLEKGLPPDTAQEQAEKRRLAMQQQLRLQQQKKSSRPPSFDGDTAVAERPSSPLSPPHGNEGAMRPRAPKETPKLASAEDVERLNRMFGSVGGEPLR